MTTTTTARLTLKSLQAEMRESNAVLAEAVAANTRALELITARLMPTEPASTKVEVKADPAPETAPTKTLTRSAWQNLRRTKQGTVRAAVKAKRA